jgi:hypothetical protein
MYRVIKVIPGTLEIIEYSKTSQKGIEHTVNIQESSEQKQKV